MTSEVKDHFYKVVHNLVKYMHRNFWKNIMTGLEFTDFQSWKRFPKWSHFEQYFQDIQWPLRSKIIFTKLWTNLWITCKKKFPRYIMTGSCIRFFQIYNFKLNNFKDIMSVKVIFLLFFFWLSMTSEIKYHFYKVVDNLVECMYKDFQKNIMTDSWFRSLKSS